MQQKIKYAGWRIDSLFDWLKKKHTNTYIYSGYQIDIVQIIFNIKVLI